MRAYMLMPPGCQAALAQLNDPRQAALGQSTSRDGAFSSLIAPPVAPPIWACPILDRPSNPGA